VSSSPQTAADWEHFFRSVAERLKVLASKQGPLEADGSGSDAYVSMYRLFNAVPDFP
jgi:hypothetical protein